MNNIDKLKVIDINNLKKFKIINKSKILESKINSWLDNGLILLPNIIDSIYSLATYVTIMDPNIGDLSFSCLDELGNMLFIKLINKSYYPTRESSIIITKDNITLEYFCINNIDNIKLILNENIKEENKYKTKTLNKKN